MSLFQQDRGRAHAGEAEARILKDNAPIDSENSCEVLPF
jgi:hypothetical protein